MTKPRQTLEQAAAEHDAEAIRLESVRGALGSWLCSIPWRYYATLTFRDGFSEPAARRAVGRFFASKGYYFAALEHGKLRAVPHVHLLQGGDLLPSRQELWEEWFARFGRALWEDIVPGKGAEQYCSKYCVKDAMNRGDWLLGGTWPQERATLESDPRPGVFVPPSFPTPMTPYQKILQRQGRWPVRPGNPWE
jgi:hypothetical protein